MKLISMTDFVLEQENDYWNGKEFEYGDTCVKNIIRYAYFLRQPLELWMFVPCDNDGNVITRKDDTGHNAADREYQEAKERCLFLNQQGEGFDYKLAMVYLNEFFNIEELANGIRLIQLTQTAIKQLEL